MRLKFLFELGWMNMEEYDRNVPDLNHKRLGTSVNHQTSKYSLQVNHKPSLLEITSESSERL